MKIGVCSGPENASLLAAAGCDYLEINVQAHLKPESPEADFQALGEQLRHLPLPCEAANCFVPGHLKITGPAVNFDRLSEYVGRAFARAERVGIKAIVFGSGAARAIPEGFSRDEAREQLIRFGQLCGNLAGEHGLTVVVEPLNRGECNVLTTVAEGGDYVRAVNHPNFQLLVDAYHWAKDREPVENILANGLLLRHAHIATYQTRFAPGREPCDFQPFCEALRAVRYAGRLSVESGWGDMAAEAPIALHLLRQICR